MNFQNLILILLSAAVLVCLLVSWLRKFTAGESCCGTKRVKVKKKKLKKTAGVITLQVEGMHCENCRRAVTEAVNSLEGHGARVDLLTKECRVSYETAPDLEGIKKRIREAGFEVREPGGL